MPSGGCGIEGAAIANRPPCDSVLMYVCVCGGGGGGGGGGGRGGGGGAQRVSASAFFDGGNDMVELRRQCLGDRCSASWEDPNSRPLGSLVEPSAGNFPQTMGAHHQEWYEQEASGIQESRPLCPSHGQLHRDSELQVKGHLCVSPWGGSCATCI